MKKELEQKFYGRWPEWFRGRNEGMRVNLMCFGFDHGDGWFDLEWKLCESLEAEGVGPAYNLFQIKEKFGGLRWYAEGGNEASNILVREAEKEADKTCEKCGQPGKLRPGGWVMTLCDECQEKR